MTVPLSERAADDLLGLADIADTLGLTPDSVRTYHPDANRRRRANEPRPQDLPAPDVRIGRTPAWKVSTIQEWVERRRSALAARRSGS